MKWVNSEAENRWVVLTIPEILISTAKLFMKIADMERQGIFRQISVIDFSIF